MTGQALPTPGVHHQSSTRAIQASSTQPYTGLIEGPTRHAPPVTSVTMSSAEQTLTSPTLFSRADDTFSAIAQPRLSKRKATATQPPPNSTFELLIHVLQPDRKVRAGIGGRQTKSVKCDPLKFGPTNFELNVTWEPFLVTISTLLRSSVPNLALPSFEWHFLKPQNSPWLPLNTEQGLHSLLRQASAKVAKEGSTYVILRMAPPIAQPTTLVSSSLHHICIY